MRLATSPGRMELHALADAVRNNDASAIDEAVGFVVAETRGVGHGRARARLARRLKHVALTSTQRRMLVDAVVRRLRTGTFSEQFDDQWRLALLLDAPTMIAAATVALDDDRAFIQRAARRVLTSAAGRLSVCVEESLQ